MGRFGNALCPRPQPYPARAFRPPRVTSTAAEPAALAAGMCWLGQAGTSADFTMDIALPMIFVGLGNRAALGTLTVAGLSGVADQDQGAALELVNVADQVYDKTKITL